MLHVRRSLTAAVVAATTVLGLAAPAAAELPALELSDSTVVRGDSVTITGHSCRNTGLGYGYLVVLDDSLNLPGGSEPVNGTWTISYDTTEHPAGRVAVHASCLQYNVSGDFYPDASFVISPGEDPEIDGSLTVSDTMVDPGDEITVSGDHFSDVVDVGVFLLSSPVYLTDAAVRQVGDDGLVDTVITIPPGTPAGTHRIVAQGWGDGRDPLGVDGLRTLAATVTVSGSTAPGSESGNPPAPASLPATGGSSSVPLTAASTLLLVAGSIAMVTADRRRRSARLRRGRA